MSQFDNFLTELDEKVTAITAAADAAIAALNAVPARIQAATDAALAAGATTEQLERITALNIRLMDKAEDLGTAVANSQVGQ